MTTNSATKARRTALDNRIEWLGKMNDQRRTAVEAGDTETLLQIAAQYAAKGMVRTANAIYIEVYTMSQREHGTHETEASLLLLG